MTVYVLNEWVWEDCLGSNGATHQAEAARALTSLHEGSDAIIVVKGTAFESKAWQLCRSEDLLRRSIAALWKDGFFYDSKKCILRDIGRLPPLGPPLAVAVKPDDHYLVQAQASAPGSVIVTTDDPLMKVLAAHELPFLSREDFLARLK